MAVENDFLSGFGRAISSASCRAWNTLFLNEDLNSFQKNFANFFETNIWEPEPGWKSFNISIMDILTPYNRFNAFLSSKEWQKEKLEAKTFS